MQNSEFQQPADPNAVPGPDPAVTPVIRRGWIRGLLFLVIFLAMPIVISIPAVLVMMVCGVDVHQLENNPSSSWTMGLQVLSMVAVLGLVLLFRKLIDRRTISSLGFRYDAEARKHLVAGLLAGFAVISTVFLILWAAGGLKIVAIQFPVGSFLGFGALFILVAIEEEAACRGYLLLNFMASMGKGWALLLSSVLFAIFHLLNPNASIVGLLNIIVAGVFLGVYYVHKRNLWFPIGIHFTWNFFQGIVFGSPVSGVDTNSVLVLETSGSKYLTGGEFGFEASLVTTVVTLLAALVVHFAYRPSERSSNMPADSVT